MYCEEGEQHICGANSSTSHITDSELEYNRVITGNIYKWGKECSRTLRYGNGRSSTAQINHRLIERSTDAVRRKPEGQKIRNVGEGHQGRG
jgi:uncharacterized cupin superfamily protein